MRLILTRLLCLTLFLCTAAQAEEAEPPPPTTINFEQRVTPRATFRIDPALHGTVQPLIDHLLEMLALQEQQQAALQEKLENAPRYLQTVNRLLGQPMDEDDAAKQVRLLRQMMGQTRIGFAGPGELTVTIVDRDSGLAHLRAGGQLPHTVYDPATDSAKVSIRLQGGRGATPHLLDQLIVTVTDDEPIETAGDHWFSVVGEVTVGGYGTGVVLTSIAEFSLMQRWIDRRTDPRWRWFSVGLASAVANRTILEIDGEAAAKQYAEAFETWRFDLPPEGINLRYWLEKRFQPNVSLRPEMTLELARQAYALKLVESIIDEHGTDWIAATLADLNAQATVSTQAIIASIRKQTGVEVDPLLDAYQTFATAAEGEAAYTAAYEEALAAERYEAAAAAAIRLLELRFDSLDDSEVGPDYERIAAAMESMDKPRIAERVRAQAPGAKPEP